jgi:hypothetical protein
MSRAVKPLFARSLHCQPARQARVLSSTALRWGEPSVRDRIFQRKAEYELKYAERIERKAREYVRLLTGLWDSLFTIVCVGKASRA